jgi:hypothetical protein
MILKRIIFSPFLLGTDRTLYLLSHFGGSNGPSLHVLLCRSITLLHNLATTIPAHFKPEYGGSSFIEYEAGVPKT